MHSDYDIDDRPCPNCNHHFTHSRDCTALYCEDGYIDEYEEDAINYAPGEEYTTCEVCHGTGVEWWCPNCGADLSQRSSDYNNDENPTPIDLDLDDVDLDLDDVDLDLDDDWDDSDLNGGDDDGLDVR